MPTQECGITDDQQAAVGAWTADTVVPVSTGDALPSSSQRVAGTPTATSVMMAEMEAMNAELDAELAALQSSVEAAKAQRSELSGMHSALASQLREAKAYAGGAPVASSAERKAC